MSTHPPPKPSAADALDRVLFDKDVAEIAAMSPAEVEAELASNGFDQEALDKSIEAALRAAGLPPIGEAPAASAPAGPKAKVVSLQAAREARLPQTRWGLLAAAAAAALVVGGGGTQLASSWRPTPTVTYPTYVPGPSPQQLARVARGRALHLCDMGYFGDCQDMLDLARRYDPAGEEDPRVKTARQDIERAGALSPPGKEGALFAKQPLGPGERPLQRW